MVIQELKPNIFCVGANDKDRKLFDALIPLPDGTTYNSYLIKGSNKIALIDTVDPSKSEIFLKKIEEANVDRIDYIISNHAEQDHSGCIPLVLKKFPDAKILCNEKCKMMIMNFFGISEDKFRIVADREKLELGDKTLEFIYTPWVHWPETMVTYLVEDKILFSCDFFGSHLAEENILNSDDNRLELASKRYYASIMMPYMIIIRKNLETLKQFDIKIIAPSHGPVFFNPEFIINKYTEWVSDKVKNIAVIAYVSMHGSTEKIVNVLSESLKSKGIDVHVYDLVKSDCGEIAIDLVDAATLVLGTPCFHTGLHPKALDALYFINSVKPKTKFISLVGSFEWASKMPEDFENVIKHMRAEVLSPLIIKGYPNENDMKLIETLALTIADKHKEIIR